MASLDDVLKLLELRVGLESEGAALAAERRTPADLVAIDGRLEAMKAAIKSGGLGADEDYAFHAAILAASQNPYFGRMMETFGSVIIPRRRLQLLGMSERQRGKYLRWFSASIVRSATPSNVAMRRARAAPPAIT